MKEKLIKLFSGIRNEIEFHSLLYDKNIDLANYTSPYQISFDLMMNFIFNKQGIELAEWWLFEGELEDKIVYEDKVAIDLSDVEVFVSYLLKHYKI